MKKAGAIVMVMVMGVGNLINFAEAKGTFISKIGNFSYYKDADPFTDEDGSYIVVEDNDRGSSLIYWQCDSGKLDIALKTGGFLYKSDEKYLVKYRFDKNEVNDSEDWYAADSGDAIFMSEDLIKDFTEAAKSSSKLAVSTTDSTGDKAVRVFELKGLNNAIKNLGCNE